jgi:5'-methylthioadenosine phosphorylase
MTFAIIGGSGYSRVIGGKFEGQIIATPYGEANIYTGERNGLAFVYLPRHGVGHTIPPHKINYRANMAALKKMGVAYVLAICTVGSLHREIPPLSLVALDQFIDYTQGRSSTYYDGGVTGVAHTEVNEPYCPRVRSALIEAAEQVGLDIRPTGTYVCTNGPRFETPAEIKMFAQFGGDVVGMTGVPEVTLARELGLHYACVALSVNWGAGMEEKIEIVEEGRQEIQETLIDICIQALQGTGPGSCECETALILVNPPQEREERA